MRKNQKVEALVEFSRRYWELSRRYWKMRRLERELEAATKVLEDMFADAESYLRWLGTYDDGMRK